MKNALAIENSAEIPKSGQAVAKVATGSTRGSLAALKQRIQKDTARHYGRVNAPQFVIRMKRGKDRGRFFLGSDLDEAAKTARDIRDHLRLHGWAPTLVKFRPASELSSDLTVGDYLDLVCRHGEVDVRTMPCYAGKFRRLVSGVLNFQHTGKEKFGGTNSPSKWRTDVDAVRLERITDLKIDAWRSQFIQRFKEGSIERTRAEHTVNSIFRNAGSLFTEEFVDRLKKKTPSLRLPNPMPFATLQLLPEHEADFFYVSGINNTELLDLAFKELSGEVLVAFVLAIGGGLRRGEIDNLMWSRIDLKQGIVTVARTATRELKTAASSGHSKLEPRFADVLRKHAQTAKGAYLLCPHIEPRSTYNFYRCALVFERLCEWLEKNGMEKTLQPIHTLRKEYGSHIAKKHGIFRASAALRHSTIAVTRRCYLSSEPTPTDYFSEESTPDNSTMSVAAEVVRMLKAQGLVAKAG